MAEQTLYQLDRGGLPQDVVNQIVLQLLRVVAEGGQLPDDSGGVLVDDSGTVRLMAPSEPRNYALQAPEVLRALLHEGGNLPPYTMEQGLYTLGLLTYEALTGQDYYLSHGVNLRDVVTRRHSNADELEVPSYPSAGSPRDLDPEVLGLTVHLGELDSVAIGEAVSWWTAFDPQARQSGTELFLETMAQLAGGQPAAPMRTIRISKAFRTGRSSDQDQTVRLMVLGNEDALETITIKTSYPSCVLSVCQENGDDLTLLHEYVVRKPQNYANRTYDLTIAFSAQENKIYAQTTDANGLDGHIIDLVAFELDDAGAR